MAAGEPDAPAGELEALLERDEAARALEEAARPLSAAAAGTPPPPPERLEHARAAYGALQRAALRAVADLAALQARVAQLLGQLGALEAQRTAAEHGFSDPLQLLDKFREDRDEAQRQAVAAADAEEAAQQQATALQQRLALLSGKLSEVEEERRAELAPSIRAARDDVALLRSQLEAEGAKAAVARSQVSSLAAQLETLQLEIEHLRSALDEERDAASKADSAPGRARQAADAAVAALRALREEEAEVAAQLRTWEAAEAVSAQETKEVVQQHAAAVKACDKLRNQIAVRERAADEVSRDIEMALVEAERLLAEQVAWDMEVEKKKGDAKREGEAVRSEQRGREVCQRRLNRAELEARQLAGELPGLQAAVSSLAAALTGEQKAAEREAAEAARLQGEVAGMVEQIAAEKKLTSVQEALVAASLADVRQLEEDTAALRVAAVERDTAIRGTMSQRDAAVRFLNQRLQRLAEVISKAEAKDGELEELEKKKGEVRGAHRDLRDLCSLMGGQMGRFRSLLEYAGRSAEDLRDRLRAAEEELASLKQAADARASEARGAERTRAAAQADKALLAAQLATQRRKAAAAAEVVDTAAIERGLLQRGAEEAQEAVTRLAASKASAAGAKASAQAGLLERDEELCGLYERSAALQQDIVTGTLALQQCDDDMRVLQLEVGELQRRLHATHKTAPDVVAYDRQIASLKAEVLRARKEAETFGAALESPKDCPDRWRVLPGKIPVKEDLSARIGQIEERLAARRDLAAQKDSVLEELERLTEGLVAQARASHDPAFDITLRMNEARRQQAAVTRRMMATVSELSLYQALSLKFSADRDALKSELAAAKAAVAAGRPPTAGTDQEFERMERDRVAEAEVRAQAAELRQLKAAGLLGAARSTVTPRPLAYTAPPGEDGELVYKPFPAAFKPVKAAEPPVAVALAAARRGQRDAAVAVPGSPVPLLAGTASA
ncbi:coiled-coil domain-containing 146-like [Chlorella sorokiniana]|uniref:Coiled-coil domain-containing 146-like n=1 Tax=Chlorella sorokiniana TaxID=3076 RepID=A0A2P6TVF9_CHLSO|nr:coiled-coil domain-containing 146-like [Chlorella sorokiniana]|eukprot:PRW58036.1 coiled-coil domain-containing 146-like [Chlorella sorokiniana]